MNIIFFILGMLNILPSRVTALAKKELIYFGPFGPVSYLGGLIFIDRLNHIRARETLEKTARHIKDTEVCTKKCYCY